MLQFASLYSIILYVTALSLGRALCHGGVRFLPPVDGPIFPGTALDKLHVYT